MPTTRIPVDVVLPPRTLLLDVAGPLEVLRRANTEQTRVRFDVRYIGPTPAVRSSIGLTIADVAPLPARLARHAMVVLAGSVDEVMPTRNVPRRATAARARPSPDAQDAAAIVDWLRTVVKPGHTVVSICSGALLAGRAGLLDGYACTTHHHTCAALAAAAPKARVLENRLYVEDRDRFSSAGVSAGIDLMLHLVSRLIDHATAVAVARYLVVYLRRSGADPQLSPWLEGRNHMHPAVHRVQDAIAADPAKAWTLASLARVAGASRRHLSRLFHEHTGLRLTDYRNRLRVALAQELLRHSRLDMEGVAERAGFGSTRQLRRAWHRVHATPPRDARDAP